MASKQNSVCIYHQVIPLMETKLRLQNQLSFSNAIPRLLNRGAEGLPARAALPAHHQAAVRGRAGVHGHQAAADGSLRLRERAGRLGAHGQPAGQPAGGGEGEGGWRTKTR